MDIKKEIIFSMIILGIIAIGGLIYLKKIDFSSCLSLKNDPNPDMEGNSDNKGKNIINGGLKNNNPNSDENPIVNKDKPGNKNNDLEKLS